MQSDKDGRVIFVDVDGVLNTLQDQTQLNAVLLSRLSRLVHLTQAKLVISSTWRLHFDQLCTLVHALAAVNIPCHRIAGITGPAIKLSPHAHQTAGSCRAEEILAFVKEHCNPHVEWVALDDLNLLDHPHMPPSRVVQTSPHKGLTVEAMRSVLAAFATELPPNEAQWSVALGPSTCTVTRNNDSGESFQLRCDEGRDWRRAHGWVHRTTSGGPFQVALDLNFPLDDAKACQDNDVYAMLLLHDAINASATDHVTPTTSGCLQSFDRFVVLEGRLSADDAVTLSVINAYTNAVESHRTWPNPTPQLTMALLRCVDEWVGEATAGLSWLLVGSSVDEWVAACGEMELPCPAYFHTWYDFGRSDLESFLASLASGEHIAPSMNVALDVDVASVYQQWAALCPPPPPHTSMQSMSPRVAQNVLELLPVLKSPCAKTQHELMKVATIDNWTLRHVLAGYVSRGDIPNGMTLDMVLAVLSDGGACSDGNVLHRITSDVDVLLW